MNVSAFLTDNSVPPRTKSQLESLGNRATLGMHQLAALIAILVLSPIMLSIAWVIWRTDGAPIFFRHYRVGQQGRLFACLKFRSMRIDAAEALAELLAHDPIARAEWQRDQKLSNDPRITSIGKFLRKTSLDELPQLINVLRGDMCFVGPRPVIPAELTRYGNTRWHYISVPPGITGLWQVSGRNQTTYQERVAYDREYVENRSLWLDMKILLRTVHVVLTGHGAG